MRLVVTWLRDMLSGGGQDRCLELVMVVVCASRGPKGSALMN